jgi:serine/threonine protein kinase
MRIGGKYTVISDLGTGGMGRLQLARSDHGKIVVIKKTLSGNADDDLRLRDEARVGMHLLHAHIVETLDLVEDQGHPALVTAYVSGASMLDLRKGGAMPPALVCRIGRQIAEALDAIHTAVDEDGRHLKMLHRDVTPGNVLLGHDGKARLIDLGIVQSLESRAQRTETGSVRGTIRYLAPELFGDGVHTIQSDIWALGVVLWEALLGREAVQGTAAAAVGRICTGHVMVLQSGEIVDGRVQRAIAQLLRTDVKDRPKRARDAAALFAMLEKDLAAGGDVEETARRLVTTRVGPPELDDPEHTEQIVNRAKSVFCSEKLSATGVGEVAAYVLEELADLPPTSPTANPSSNPLDAQKNARKDAGTPPRPLTPPHGQLPRLETPSEGISNYVRMLASLERRGNSARK